MKKLHNLGDKYNPKDFEERLYEGWNEKGYFKPNMDKTKPTYSIVMPPPNVTRKIAYGSCIRCGFAGFIN